MMSGCLTPAIFIMCVLNAINFCWSARVRYKPPLEEEWEITCFTCQDAANNSICNRFAIDRPCPKGTDFCQTLHVLTEDGTSILVNKKCAVRTECRPRDVGCFEGSTPEHTVCVSCCDIQYCNDYIPMNGSSAVLINTRFSSSAKNSLNYFHFYLVIFLTFSMHFSLYTIL
uniref:UPAR/Ly6 domain-containing protein n=1 Tax=Strigamia maritima TaxID=126957 RepID=T1JAC4_STRMM